MIVQSRRWRADDRGFQTGKMHWMTEPWITTCGRDVGRDWSTPPGHYALRSGPGHCKKCFPERADR